MGSCFQLFFVFVCQIFGIVRSQIETKSIFSLAKILVNLNICRL
jgi:hypothetical protein